MLWRFFGSDEAVEKALKQSRGYDISPQYLRVPTNSNEKKKEDGMRFIAPWEDDSQQSA